MFRFLGFFVFISLICIVCSGLELDLSYISEDSLSKITKAPSSKKGTNKAPLSLSKFSKAPNNDKFTSKKKAGCIEKHGKDKGLKAGCDISIPSNVPTASPVDLAKVQDNCICGWLTTTTALSTTWTDGCDTNNVPSNKLSGGLCSGWAGITCDGSADIISITMYSATVGGIIPTCLGDLNTLTALKLLGDQFTGNIPSSLGRLNLNNNKLINTIPSSLFKLTNIKNLNLQHNSLVGTIPSVIGTILSLTFFRIDFNTLTGTIPDNFCTSSGHDHSAWNLVVDNTPGLCFPACLNGQTGFSHIAVIACT